MTGAYKWAYDDKIGTLDVWEVNGPESWASPQHGDHLTAEEYMLFYQGRIVLDAKGKVVSFTFYDDRPYEGRTDDGAARAKNAIDQWVEGV